MSCERAMCVFTPVLRERVCVSRGEGLYGYCWWFQATFPLRRLALCAEVSFKHGAAFDVVGTPKIKMILMQAIVYRKIS